MSRGATASDKAICSICYEDLKPIAEDLQAISVCGHVFHELCLQQWFEYCSGAKKNNCPVCKQNCPVKNVHRLYFQSVGDADDSILSQKPQRSEDEPESARREKKRLEVKISGLSSALERYQNDLKELSEELHTCKETAQKEADSKSDILKQNASAQLMLRLKSEELEKSTLECSRLQERNMNLAKELAALKLVTDLNLEEDDVLKYASFGNEGSKKDTVDVLSRSLVIRNKSYSELIAKCNLLGRGEARTLKKLEKAHDKIKKLKARVQELELSIEKKDNEFLRALKASKKATSQEILSNGISATSNYPLTDNNVKEPETVKTDLDQVQSPSGVEIVSQCENLNPVNDIGFINLMDYSSAADLKGQEDSYILADEDIPELSDTLHGCPAKPETTKDVSIGGDTRKRNFLLSTPNLDVHSRSCGVKKDSCHDVRAATGKENVILVDDDFSEDHPLFNIRKETSLSASIAQSGNFCFSGGLVGPDGTQRYLGRWCKRARTDGTITSSMSMHGSSASVGNLIATGADGRGGKIKILRSLNKPPNVLKGSSELTKRCKQGGKSSLQTKGCLQIENFFGKVGR